MCVLVSLAAYILKKTILVLRALKLMSLGYKRNVFNAVSHRSSESKG